MAMNPMQRKANNSFLLGILITLLITGIIIAFLIYQVSQLNTQLKEEEALKVTVYVVTDTIKSGEAMNPDKLQLIETTLGSVDKSNFVTTLNTYDAENTATGEIETVYTQKAKVDLNPGTVITNDLIYEDEALTADVRTQEYNVITPMTQLTTGEYIDVRLRTPDGRDLIVVSHKQVTIPELADGTVSSTNMLMDLSEEETLMMSCAIVETYQMNGAKLYATKYVEPGTQTAATPTYVPNDETRALIERDPNIVQEAKNAMITRYNENAGQIRGSINGEISQTEEDDRTTNLNTGITTEVTTAQEQRQSYLEALAGN